jgi:hypothetical protein
MLSQERVIEDKKNEKPILFASKVLGPAEANIQPEAKSLKAAKFAIQQFRPYLHDCSVIIRTNDRLLMQLQDKPTKQLTTAQGKWIALIKDISPKFELKTTKTNEAVNALADCWEDDIAQPLCALIQQQAAETSNGIYVSGFTTAHQVMPHNLFRANEKTYDFDPQTAYIAPSFQDDDYNPVLVGYEWKDMQTQDKIVSEIKKSYEEGNVETREQYFIDPADVVYRKFDDKLLLLVPKALQKRTIQMYHDTPRAGHYANRRTYLALRQSVWWKGMKEDVTQYVKDCFICQYYKLHVGKAPHMPRSIPPYPFYIVSIDLVGPLPPTRRGYEYIMVCQDAFSKWTEMIPIKNNRTIDVVESFMNTIVIRYGPPLKILTDRGSQFTSTLYAKMCAFFGTRSLLTTSYRPQCNGANERTHKEIKRYLAMFKGGITAESKNPIPWDILVRYASWAYNTTYHSVLRMTPYEVLFNRPPQVHALGALGGEHRINERVMQMFGEDSDKPGKASKNLTGEDAEFYQLLKIDKERAAEIQKQISEYLLAAQQRWAKSPQLVESKPKYQSGDYILLRNMVARANTMLPKYTGPYEVKSRKGPVTYEIARPEKHFVSSAGRDFVHLDRMKPFHNPDPGQPVQPLFLENSEENEEDDDLEITEITPAGLDAVVRLSADTQIPVPIISRYYVDNNGQIQENLDDIKTEAAPDPIELFTEDLEANLRTAADDDTPNPFHLHDEQQGVVTRSMADKLKLKVKELFQSAKRK